MRHEVIAWGRTRWGRRVAISRYPGTGVAQERGTDHRIRALGSVTEYERMIEGWDILTGGVALCNDGDRRKPGRKS